MDIKIFYVLKPSKQRNYKLKNLSYSWKPTRGENNDANEYGNKDNHLSCVLMENL